MKRTLPHVILCFVASILFSGCESTLDYGYYVEGLNDESIELLFSLSDEAASNMDIATYGDLFGPSFSAVDKTSGDRRILYRHDFLDMVEQIFKTYKYVEMTTVIMDIQYTEPGRRATVKVQEEEKRVLGSNTQHYTSILDVEIGYEDGWIFIEKSTRTSSQVIDE